MKCAICDQEKLPYQAAHHKCTECGQELAHCFVCDYQAYAAVDAFRKLHEVSHAQVDALLNWREAEDIVNKLLPPMEPTL